jgi:putative ABC transport system substrate-binding protein
MNLTVLKANGSSQLAESQLKASLREKKPNLVVTNATLASKAAVRILKGTNIPQLFVTVSDPVGSKIVEKIGVPTGKNITGRVHNITRETKVKLVLQLIGNKVKKRPIRYGYIHSTYPSSMGDIQKLKALAEKIAI